MNILDLPPAQLQLQQRNPLSSNRYMANTIDPNTLRSRMDAECPRILDVRTPAEFESAHIPGAYNVPLDLLREHRKELAARINPEVILVCRSGVRATQAEHALTQAGLPGVRILDGGMMRWEQSGGPVSRGRRTWELERQVRLVAGSIVTGSLAASIIWPWAKWLAAGIGSGLTVAALTDTCAMGMFLAKMPWNQTTNTPDITTVLTALDEQ
jgi:rhodanese-related sulfurtransferase